MKSPIDSMKKTIMTKPWQLGMIHKQSIFGTPLQDGIIIDSGSSLDVFRSKSKVNNIQEAEQPLGIGTNGSKFEIKTIADIHNYGSVWFNEQSITNIFSLAKLTDCF